MGWRKALDGMSGARGPFLVSATTARTVTAGTSLSVPAGVHALQSHERSSGSFQRAELPGH